MSEKWSRDECIVALDLYLNGENFTIDASDELVREVASAIDRSPGAVEARLANFKSVDPNGTVGLTNISSKAKSVWYDYHDSQEELRAEAESARFRLQDGNEPSAVTVETSETTVESVARHGQREFRTAVLERYGDECVLCDVDHRGLLIASHILPWGQYEEERGDPENGIVL